MRCNPLFPLYHSLFMLENIVEDAWNCSKRRLVRFSWWISIKLGRLLFPTVCNTCCCVRLSLVQHYPMKNGTILEDFGHFFVFQFRTTPFGWFWQEKSLLLDVLFKGKKKGMFHCVISQLLYFEMGIFYLNYCHLKLRDKFSCFFHITRKPWRLLWILLYNGIVQAAILECITVLENF